jgi:hydroxyethylthiazole kinase-like uncharacterized protein yjeF
VEQIKSIPALPRRTLHANKGDCGKVLVVGGSRGMSGAPCLAAKAAYRSGAGLVRVAVPESIWDIVAANILEILSVGIAETKTGAASKRAKKTLLEAAIWADAVVLGPGMTQADETQALIRLLVAEIDKPLVLDADGLNAFSGDLAGLKRKSKAPLVLTPHPGEMARLLKMKIPDIQGDRVAAVTAAAAVTGAVVILKGANTLVCDGARLYENKTGNPGMATGGTGDVLSGLIGGLIGQGLPAFDAAVLGVFLHGTAGDLAAKRLGVWSLLAGDLIDELPNAFLVHAKTSGVWY